MGQVFEGFVGPSYQLANRFAAIERTVNWYLNVNEAAHEESKFSLSLEPSPCNQAFCELPVPAPYNSPNRGLIELRDQVFGVNGTVVFKMASDGAFTNIGTVVSDGSPCSIVANGTGQVFIASARHGYVIPNGGAAGSLVSLDTNADFLGASYAAFQDGYIIVLTPNSNQFQISGNAATPLGDATVWDAANVSIQAGQADLLSALNSSREYLRLLGRRRSQVYQNVGNSGVGGFPFANYEETFIETGIAAPFSLADLGGELVWIGQDARGVRAAWLDRAFQPERISTFAVEQRWGSYARVDDAIAFSYTWLGHSMWRVTFPTAYVNAQGVKTSASWEYDHTVSELLQRRIWTQRQYLTGNGVLQGRPELFHCFAFGKHLMASGGGDGNPGAIYQLASAPWTDCGVDSAGSQSQRQTVRDRVCPHLWRANSRRIYNRIEFVLNPGPGLTGVADTDPQVLLRWSNDGGATWTPEYNIPAGRAGEYLQRVYYNRCGWSRDRVFWLRCSDAVYWGIINALLDITELSQ